MLNVMFSWSLGLKPAGCVTENYLSAGVLEPCRNMQNLAHFEQFSPNNVGDPFGLQDVGARPLETKANVSQLS